MSTAAETLRWLRPYARAHGVSRIADLTFMDWIGVPVFQTVRPRSKSYVVSQGKGLDRDTAEVSALMEAMEFMHAEEAPAHERASLRAMRARLPWPPEALNAKTTALPDDLVLDWTRARDLVTGAETFVPTGLVCLDFTVRPEPRCFPFRTTSSGLGAGESRARAILHGLYENAERDALSDGRGAALARQGWPPGVAALDALLDAADIELTLERLESRFGLPCFRATIVQRETSLQIQGSACRAGAEAAMVAAVLEAIQSRAGVIAGARDDLSPHLYPGFRALVAPGDRDVARTVHADAGAPAPFPTIDAELTWLVAVLHAQTGYSPVVVDLGRADGGPEVLFTVCPGLRFTTEAG